MITLSSAQTVSYEHRAMPAIVQHADPPNSLAPWPRPTSHAPTPPPAAEDPALCPGGLSHPCCPAPALAIEPRAAVRRACVLQWRAVV